MGLGSPGPEASAEREAEPTPGPAAVEESLEAQTSGGSEGGGDVAVGLGAQDGEDVAHGMRRSTSLSSGRGIDLAMLSPGTCRGSGCRLHSPPACAGFATLHRVSPTALPLPASIERPATEELGEPGYELLSLFVSLTQGMSVTDHDGRAA